MSRFIKEKYKDFKSYTPGEQPKDTEYLKLNTNESPFPPAPEVVNALKEADMERLRLYPDPTGAGLKRKLADLYGLEPSNVFLSNGSDDILNFSFMAFNDTDDELVLPDVTYSFYEVVLNLHGVNYETIPLKDDLSIDWREYCGIGKNIVIPNPNAPTGIALKVSEIEEIVRTNPDNVVLVDEAYVDFGADSSVGLVRKYDNVLIAQTFSKSRSFAGGRLGFALADEELIKDLAKMQYSTNPYNVNTISLILAEAAVDADAYYKKNTVLIGEMREYATAELRKMGFTVLPSSTNFIFVRHDRMGGKEIYEKLKEKGVLVRHFDRDRIRDYNRITIGTKDQMDELIAKLSEVLEG